MAATFNAAQLPDGAPSRVTTTRPAIAGAGGAAPSAGVDAAAAINAHVAEADPHTQYLLDTEAALIDLRLQGVEQAPATVCHQCLALEKRVAALEQLPTGPNPYPALSLRVSALEQAS